MKHGGNRTGAGGKRPRLKPEERKKHFNTRLAPDLISKLDEMAKQGYTKAALIDKALRMFFREWGKR